MTSNVSQLLRDTRTHALEVCRFGVSTIALPIRLPSRTLSVGSGQKRQPLLMTGQLETDAAVALC